MKRGEREREREERQSARDSHAHSTRAGKVPPCFWLPENVLLPLLKRWRTVTAEATENAAQCLGQHQRKVSDFFEAQFVPKGTDRKFSYKVGGSRPRKPQPSQEACSSSEEGLSQIEAFFSLSAMP